MDQAQLDKIRNHRGAFKVTSTVARSWPAFGVAIPAGKSILEKRPALTSVFDQIVGLAEGGLLTLEPIVEERKVEPPPAKGSKAASQKGDQKAADQKADQKAADQKAGDQGAQKAADQVGGDQKGDQGAQGGSDPARGSKAGDQGT